jgi:hypothetical protein
MPCGSSQPGEKSYPSNAVRILDKHTSLCQCRPIAISMWMSRVRLHPTMLGEETTPRILKEADPVGLGQ